ncbi:MULTISPECIES: hypothetical protein [unclassified Methylobacterium]|uniref:hypothetical protein n=1 Tax=unclassified Methylobacterium TaxID=2615210 RepID=UPI0011CAE2C3|nr:MULTISPECIES: hypothetical protein [unclassified Methylobacterium]TXM66859.1 hypothetical protein FV229_11575 [Methylobacterium sp. WL120]
MGQRDDDDGRIFRSRLPKKAVGAEERARTLLTLQRIASTIGVPVVDFFKPTLDQDKDSAEPEEENQG